MTPGHYFARFALSGGPWTIAHVNDLGDVWIIGSAEVYSVEEFEFGGVVNPA